MALAWNPTKSRNHGTMVLYPTPQGLWVGSDGERFGREDHVGIGFVPLNPGPTPDTVRPNTTITSGPSGSVTDPSATFGFSSTEAGTFQCRLDGAAFAPCTSPKTYTDLAVGSHTLQVVAVDGSLNVDSTPAARTWNVVAARPDGRIRRGTGPLVGNNVYNTTGSGQTRTGTAARGGRVTYYVSAQNDASGAERLWIRGQGSTRWFTVLYRNPAGANITNEVTNGTYRTPNLAPNGTHQIKVIVTVDNAAPGSASVTRTLTAFSTTQPPIKDAVGFVTSRA
jgi:hypothetical protein